MNKLLIIVTGVFVLNYSYAEDSSELFKAVFNQVCIDAQPGTDEAGIKACGCFADKLSDLVTKEDDRLLMIDSFSGSHSLSGKKNHIPDEYVPGVRKIIEECAPR